MVVHEDHLDPEVLAAWVDGSLDEQSRADAEAHAADCARCQAVLAAMVRIEPPAEPKRSWFASPLRWLVPIAAAAAALAVWVAVSPDRETAMRIEPPAQSPGTFADRATSIGPAETRAADQRASARVEERPASPAVPKTGSGETAASQVALPESAAARTSTAASAQRREAAELDRLQPMPAPPATAAPAAAAAPRPVAQVPPLESLGQVAGRRATMSATAPLDIATSDGSVRWRIIPPAGIQRSTDGGRTWTAQASGVTTDLLAGSAPSSTVAWLVGRSGVVLLTTDGQTWRRVSFPVPVDLLSVAANDAKNAVVTTADRRTFRTSDGGLTWHPSQ